MTDTNSEDNNAATDELSPAPRKSKTPLFIAVGVVCGAALGMLFVGPQMAASSTAAEVSAPADEHGAPAEGEHGAAAAAPHLLENLVVNPADSRGTRFLLVTIGLQMRDAAAQTDITARDAQVRDRVLEVLGAKTIDQLVDIRGRDNIRHEIAVSLDSLFGSGKVRAVFFPQFVIQ